MKKIFKFLLSSLVLLAFVACGGDKGGASSESSKTLTVAQGADAKSLDPHATNDQPSARVAAQIYNGLVEQDTEMKIQPALAEKWEQKTPTETVFYLRKGVKFHNGEEVKAQDVKFSLERMEKSPTVAEIIEAVKEINVIDEYTVSIVTKYPFGPLLNHLSHPAASILNEKTVKEAGDKYGQNPVGTGPFKFEKWTSGESIILKANKDYFKGAPATETIIFRSIPEDTNRYIGLETKEIDISYDLGAMDRKNIKEKKDLMLIEEPASSTTYIGLNMKKDIFKDKRVRQAIAYAMDIQPIIDTVWQGSATKANSAIGPLVFGYSKDAKAYEHNVEKAKALLKEAGYENGLSFKIWVNDNPIRRDIATIFQDQMRQVGINVTVETLEWGAFLDRTSSGESDAFILGWGTVTGDADYGLYPLYHTKQQGGAGNRAFYSNPKVDALLDQARSETNSAKRVELYAEIQAITQEELPMISVAYVNQNAGMQKDVKNFKLNPSGHHKLYSVTK